MVAFKGYFKVRTSGEIVFYTNNEYEKLKDFEKNELTKCVIVTELLFNKLTADTPHLSTEK